MNCRKFPKKILAREEKATNKEITNLPYQSLTGNENPWSANGKQEQTLRDSETKSTRDKFPVPAGLTCFNADFSPESYWQRSRALEAEDRDTFII